MLANANHCSRGPEEEEEKLAFEDDGLSHLRRRKARLIRPPYRQSDCKSDAINWVRALESGRRRPERVMFKAGADVRLLEEGGTERYIQSSSRHRWCLDEVMKMRCSFSFASWSFPFTVHWRWPRGLVLLPQPITFVEHVVLQLLLQTLKSRPRPVWKNGEQEGNLQAKLVKSTTART